LFGARCGFAAAFVSVISIVYFAIPPKNSFAIQSAHDLWLLCSFVLLAFITSATLAVLTDITEAKDEPQLQQ
jgi:K+-sensing histidine kinase KdpD